MTWRPWLLLLAGAVLSLGSPARGEDELFEKKIRPLLVERCFACHSAGAKKLEGSLRLDSREGMLQGGASGPAIVPGHPEGSLLVTAIHYTDPDLSMPPKERLAPDQVELIEAWIRAGAPWPHEAAPSVAPVVSLWALAPVGDPEPPAVKGAWATTPIDRFVLSRLEAAGLTPAPAADKRTLLRRATFDLTGLPPTPEETDAFLADPTPFAYERVLDRLLDSPRYGERWGRYWLDVARYADTKGYVFNEERRYAYSYTYRDWVIRAINEDLPYDEFLIQQIAADRLPPTKDHRSLAALGFLTLGRRFLNNVFDIIDDRIDVLTRGTMALTVTCARCHDHKFDPIPTKDYYSLYGVLACANEPVPPPLLVDPPPETPEYLAYKKELAGREAEIVAYRGQHHAELVAAARKPEAVVEYLVLAHETRAAPSDADADKRGLNPLLLQRWRATLADPIFAPFRALGEVPEGELAARGGAVVAEVASRVSVNAAVVAALSSRTHATMRDVAKTYATLLSGEESLRPFLTGPAAPPSIPFEQADALFTHAEHDKIRELRNKVDELTATHAGAPPRAMSLEDGPPGEQRVFLRGNPGNPGEPVPRQFLLALEGKDRKAFTEGSGRLELARAIASKKNPLTARVFVNRVWLHHFGAGLVRTPSDFGTRSEPPSHPELLDWLATRFMEDGWSQKKLHRRIMLSSAYRESSDESEAGSRLDPENVLLSRANVRRLDLEAMRDTILAVSGQLDLTMGGRAVEIVAPPGSPRRTVYGFIDRQNLPGFFRTFDFASPDTHSPERHTTSVPQQALFLLDSPFMVEAARRLAARTEKEEDPDARVHALYRLVLGRAPEPDELTLGVRFVLGQALAPIGSSTAWEYGYGAYDPESKRIKAFKALPHFTGEARQGGAVLPDSELGWCVLSAAGGHPGNDLAHAVIRRFHVPGDGVVTIEGKLVHGQRQGDGVQARIVSSERGELGAWVAHDGEIETKLENVPVRAGETLDFYVDCRKHPDYDSFGWSPTIRTGANEWSAARDFTGPPPSPQGPWEKYAHVLLLTNELHFVE